MGRCSLCCQKLLQTRSFLPQHLKKFYPKLVFQSPLNSGGLNGDGNRLFL